jgi:hypothetical protein
MEAKVVCENCKSEEWTYKHSRTTDKKVLCVRCQHLGRDMFKTDFFTLKRLQEGIEFGKEFALLKHKYLRTLAKDYISVETPLVLEDYIKVCVDKERFFTETFIKKDRLTININEQLEMMSSLIKEFNNELNIDGKVRMDEFERLYEKEVSRK